MIPSRYRSVIRRDSFLIHFCGNLMLILLEATVDRLNKFGKISLIHEHLMNYIWLPVNCLALKFVSKVRREITCGSTTISSKNQPALCTPQLRVGTCLDPMPCYTFPYQY